MTIKITTNNQFRPLVYGYELTDKEKEYFDYLDDVEADFTGFRYKGDLYDLGEFIRIDHRKGQPMTFDEFADYDGVHTETMWSGILVKYSDCGDGVKVGTYCS